ncbi:hypothetical protein HCA78_16180 [Listeria booriae]|uniref:Cyclic lactone autoinducer peptide n=1 Tax=Listeria booriae TaxID=1552123 RepID=A0A842CZ81_9LIST|nr:hypothetical protein [Listeria booriae]MBC2005314.1 hypothetical protein [Listeria booriae]
MKKSRMNLNKLKNKISLILEEEAYKNAEKSVKQSCLLYSYEPPVPNMLLSKNTK